MMLPATLRTCYFNNTRFYECHSCAIYNAEIEDLYVAWRKALRKVWKLSYVTHCRLLPYITDLLLRDVIFRKRFLSQNIGMKIVWLALYLDHQYSMYLT